MTDLNAMVRRMFQEVIVGGNLALVDELVADDFKTEMPTPVPGKEGFRQVVKAWRAAFPDMTMTFNDVLVSGDKVTTRGVIRGTHKGEFNGIPATGKRVEARFIDIWQARNGKFVENWVQIDMLSMLTQLGVVPPPPAK